LACSGVNIISFFLDIFILVPSLESVDVICTIVVVVVFLGVTGTAGVTIGGTTGVAIV